MDFGNLAPTTDDDLLLFVVCIMCPYYTLIIGLSNLLQKRVDIDTRRSYIVLMSYNNQSHKGAHTMTQTPGQPSHNAIMGMRLINMLDLQLKDGRVDTTWGTKTPHGLYVTLKRFIEEAEGKDDER